ncbi:unnamed protein product [Protopolystoma xenopodis]|uniref:Uncharacterized protein n=1 Tax=Protopolystoma xenopodis TaxID=117903 RepID=A0A3S5BL92_9PLAT|nr:unnamed protein product [Protopolystoma xenopodis]
MMLMNLISAALHGTPLAGRGIISGLVLTAGGGINGLKGLLAATGGSLSGLSSLLAAAGPGTSRSDALTELLRSVTSGNTSASVGDSRSNNPLIGGLRYLIDDLAQGAGIAQGLAQLFKSLNDEDPEDALKVSLIP